MKRAWVLLLALWTGVAEAGVRRFAVLASSNRGFASEPELRFAESDADRISSVLSKLGGFEPADIVSLKGPTPSEVESTLNVTYERIRAAQAVGDQVVLFVFYAGHGDAQDLHLGSQTLGLGILRESVVKAPADFRVLVIDSCRSGGATGVRGAHAVPAFDVHLDDHLPGEGYAVVTSASVDEDAQESEKWGGSVFTHAFVAALSGAADATGDGEVTLHEAYGYTYQQTIRVTRSTLPGPQHPTFEFDIKGKGSLVLSRTQMGHSSLGAVLLDMPGSYFFVRPDDSVALEVSFSEGSRRVLVPGGRYRVERRSRDRLWVSELELAGAESFRLDETRMEVLEYSRAVRRGGIELSSVSSLSAGARVRGPVSSTWPAAAGVSASWDIHFSSLTLTLGGELGGSSRNGLLEGQLLDGALAIGVLRGLDLGPLTLLVGGELGACGYRESFTSENARAPSRLGGAGMARAVIGADWPLHGPWLLRIRGAVGTILLRERESASEPSHLILPVVPWVSIGLGYMGIL